jgi:hypothetical protein
VVLDAVGLRHLTERLELAVRLDAALHVSMSWWYEDLLASRAGQVDAVRADSKDTARHPDRAVRLDAYLLLAHRDGWAEFVSRLKIDPAHAGDIIPVGGVLLASEKSVTDLGLAMSEADTISMVRESDPDGEGKVVTAAGVADRLESEFDTALGVWEGL